ncbi:MAG: hypothetical protein AAFR35_15065 [Pseudomonadota bacterium]
MVSLSLDTGSDAVADGAKVLTADAFGARYISYNSVNRFLDQIDDMEIGHIVWPGGTLAETREDRFGFEYEGLYDPATNKPDLSEMMGIARAEGVGLTVVLPTARYEGDVASFEADLNVFLEDLLSGEFGTLPNELVLEVGSEYYAHFEGANAATSYAELADAAVTEIALALVDSSINTLGADVEIAVQMGRTSSEDAEIRDGLSDFSLSNVDSVIHHRFAFLPDGIDGRVAEIDARVDRWVEDVEAAGGDAPALNVSAWNVATQTRAEVLQDFLAENPGLTADDVDLDGRTTVAFERYWQDALDDAAYGAEHPGYILEAFHSYAEIGMEDASVYGIDLVHPGRLSVLGEDGKDYVFAGGDMLEMLYESVDDTEALEGRAFNKNAAVMPYAFENEDKLIVFLAAGDTNPGTVDLNMEGIGTEYLSVWGDSLQAEIDPDWMETFGIPDTPGVDETNEAWTYAEGVRDGTNVTEIDGGVSVTFEKPHEVIRLAFAKTDAGANEISKFSDGSEVQLDLPPVTDPPPDPEPEDDPDLDDAGDDDGGGGGAGFAIAGLLPFLLLLV